MSNTRTKVSAFIRNSCNLSRLEKKIRTASELSGGWPKSIRQVRRAFGLGHKLWKVNFFRFPRLAEIGKSSQSAKVFAEKVKQLLVNCQKE